MGHFAKLVQKELAYLQAGSIYADYPIHLLYLPSSALLGIFLSLLLY